MKNWKWILSDEKPKKKCFYIHTMDDVYASQFLTVDNEDNRNRHRMISKDDLIISMDFQQAITWDDLVNEWIIR